MSSSGVLGLSRVAPGTNPLPIHGIAAENRRFFTIKARPNLVSMDTTRLAVLIDADNASASVAKELLEEVAKFGTAMVKRAFGDWTTQNLIGWKAHLHRHAIQPIQQFAYTQGKNSTDPAFIIDTMDLLYSDSSRPATTVDCARSGPAYVLNKPCPERLHLSSRHPLQRRCQMAETAHYTETYESLSGQR